MQDDSSINSGSARKSAVNRAQTLMSGSFRMAASVLGPNASRKAISLTVGSIYNLIKISSCLIKNSTKNRSNARYVSMHLENSGNITVVSAPMQSAHLAHTPPSINKGTLQATQSMR